MVDNQTTQISQEVLTRAVSQVTQISMGLSFMAPRKPWWARCRCPWQAAARPIVSREGSRASRWPRLQSIGRCGAWCGDALVLGRGRRRGRTMGGRAVTTATMNGMGLRLGGGDNGGAEA
jgi:hypothetical protein